MKKKDLANFNTQHYGKPIENSRRFVKLLRDLKTKDSELIKLKDMAKKLINAKWETINIVICFDPQATPRPRTGRSGIFYVKGAKDNYNLFNEFLDEMKRPYELVTTPCKIRIDSYFEIPKQMNRFEKMLAELGLVRPVSKPDWENIAKTYPDMIQKSLLHDDCTIVSGSSNKYYSYLPRVEITIEYMVNYDCKYNKKKVESWKISKDADITTKDSEV